MISHLPSHLGILLFSTVRIILIVLLSSSAICLADNSENKSSELSSSDTQAPITDIVSPESWNFYGQFTNVTQWHRSFDAPYNGTNSLDNVSKQANTNDVTFYIGARLWEGGNIYLNPEIDEGFGLSNTLGLAGFSSGEAYKVGKSHPYIRFQRVFFQQVINLSGTEQKIASGANQLAGSKMSDNITLTIGKFSAVDIFDTNTYAHDPRKDFLNWSILDAGAFDYAADAWGYTYGIAAEWTQSWWTIRGGLLDLSTEPNSKYLESTFKQFSLIGELEERHHWLGRSGKLKLLGFANHGRMANYEDAVRLAQKNGSIADVSQVRHFNTRPGIAISLEQELTSNLGMFVKASVNDGSKEAFEFTDINKSLSTGISLQGDSWGRKNDTIGIAGAVNGISSAARDYFAAGGLGILVGDGQLQNYRTEKIIEAYYSMELNKLCKISMDYQYIVNPAYNGDRGPVSIFGFRAHAEF